MKNNQSIKKALSYALTSTIAIEILFFAFFVPNIILESRVPWGLNDITSWKELREWLLIGFPIYFIIFLLIPLINKKLLKQIEPQAEDQSIKDTLNKIDKHLYRYTLTGSIILTLLFVVLMPFVMTHIAWGSPLWVTNLWACLAFSPMVMGVSILINLIIYFIIILIRGPRHY